MVDGRLYNAPMSSEFPTWPGRVIVAARGLAGLSARELAEAAGVHRNTIVDIEARNLVPISPKLRHGHVAAETWEKIVRALGERGVELVPGGEGHGPGVRIKGN